MYVETKTRFSIGQIARHRNNDSIIGEITGIAIYIEKDVNGDINSFVFYHINGEKVLETDVKLVK